MSLPTTLEPTTDRDQAVATVAEHAAAIARLTNRLNNARAARNEAIVAARKVGATQASLAAAAGISQSVIVDICNNAPADT